MHTTRPLGLGIVGLGRAFTLMLPTFMNDPRVRIVAGVDPRAEARAMFSRDFGGPAYEDLRELLAHPEVEVVYIASPHQFHARHVAQVAAASRHILIEKPLALSLAECEQIIQAVDEAGVILVVGHSHSFDAPVQQAVSLLRRGELGPVRMVHAAYYTDFLYRPRRPEELDTARGGGVIFSQAAHQVDIVRLLGGGCVRSVMAHTGNWDPARPTEGAYSALMSFEGGAFASLTYSGYGRYDSDEAFGGISELGLRKAPDAYGAARRRLAASSFVDEAAFKVSRNYGGEGFRLSDLPKASHHEHFGHILVSTSGADLRLTPDGLTVYEDRRRYDVAIPLGEAPRSGVIDELHMAIRTGAPVVHDAAWGRATMEVCLAILESARSREAQALRFQCAAR